MKKLLPKYLSKPQGFTLIELMVVIAIIAVLAAAGVAIFSNSQKTARDGRRRADIEAISKALETNYNTTVNQYCNPASADTYCAPLATWSAGNALPTDPQTGANYLGEPAVGAANYTICALLENAQGNSSNTAGASATGTTATYYCLKSQQN